MSYFFTSLIHLHRSELKFKEPDCLYLDSHSTMSVLNPSTAVGVKHNHFDLFQAFNTSFFTGGNDCLRHDVKLFFFQYNKFFFPVSRLRFLSRYVWANLQTARFQLATIENLVSAGLVSFAYVIQRGKNNKLHPITCESLSLPPCDLFFCWWSGWVNCGRKAYREKGEGIPGKWQAMGVEWVGEGM